jgi:hypothetical protein
MELKKERLWLPFWQGVSNNYDLSVKKILRLLEQRGDFSTEIGGSYVFKPSNRTEIMTKCLAITQNVSGNISFEVSFLEETKDNWKNEACLGFFSVLHLALMYPEVLYDLGRIVIACPQERLIIMPEEKRQIPALEIAPGKMTFRLLGEEEKEVVLPAIKNLP